MIILNTQILKNMYLYFNKQDCHISNISLNKKIIPRLNSLILIIRIVYRMACGQHDIVKRVNIPNHMYEGDVDPMSSPKNIGLHKTDKLS